MSWLRWVVLAVAIPLIPGFAKAYDTLGFSLEFTTWPATHIAVVEGQTVVESWRGDWKPDQQLPDGAAEFARMKPPTPPVTYRLTHPVGTGAPVAVSRMVLFLTRVEGWKDGKPADKWYAASGFGKPGSAELSVVWLEAGQGGRAFVALPCGDRRGGYVTAEFDTFKGLKEKARRILALRVRLDRANAEPDPTVRAKMLTELFDKFTPTLWIVGKYDLLDPLRKCGEPGIRQLLLWAMNPRSPYSGDAIGQIGFAGEEATEGLFRLLNDEAAYWKEWASRAKPGEQARDEPSGRGPRRLWRVLDAARYRLLWRSDRNRQLLREHPSLQTLKKVLENPPFKPIEGSDFDQARGFLRTILASP
ncbi:MAG TPA: hypothetical protein VFG68_02580 [Fimbriiglobus sp.]|nr:hypothetical protein [Fimbriiglobus sp.]